MCRSKAYIARQQHGTRKLDGRLVNDWFSDPKGFLGALAKSSLVNITNPERSEIIKKMGSFGPMFRVFSPAEEELFVDWIRSLDAATPVVPPLPPPTTDAGAGCC